ncbi:MAG: DODA-type extradiol aromatic ring-opening family dioxygenase [Alphaproteobacteria bacterium]
MASFPTVFVSHGPPTMALEPIACHRFLKRLGAELGRPEAVLCVSAHWETERPRVSAAARPETIHDFFGFPEPLYQLRYPAPGAPGLARRSADLLAAAGLDGDVDPHRGLDHGAWVPLMLMYADADVPVTQLSIQRSGDGAHHLALGRALAPLRSEGVLVLASGNATHNLAERGAPDDPPHAWAQAFDDWLTGAVEAGRDDDLVQYLNVAPEAARNHPTPDHFMPLLVALGAAGADARGRRLHASFTWATLSMAAFSFS